MRTVPFYCRLLKDEICQKIKCPGYFRKMPPLFHGFIMGCFTDTLTRKTGEEVARGMGLHNISTQHDVLKSLERRVPRGDVND